MKNSSIILIFLLTFFLKIIAQNSVEHSYQKAISKINSKLEEAAGSGKFSGQLLIAKDGKILLNEGYGLADREQNIAMTNKHLFDICSITKQFTAAAILKLEEEGLLSVNDKITKYFDNVPPDKKDITLHHLLTHASGLPPSVGRDYDAVNRDSLVRAAFNAELKFEPGNGYKYSNTGYSLLGAIIEIVSGMPYENFLRENLFKPAGILRTGYVLPKFKEEELAVGYWLGKELWGRPTDYRWAEDGPYWNLKTNGGTLSSCEQLFKWYTALRNGNVLSKQSVKKLFTPHNSETDAYYSYYCYGWVESETLNGEKLISHNGSNGTFYSEFRAYPESGWILIGMTNAKTETAKALFEHILLETAEKW